MRRYLRKKRNFSELEAKTLTSEVERNKEVLFGSIQTGIKRAHKTAVWRRITAAVNRVAVEERTPAEVPATLTSGSGRRLILNALSVCLGEEEVVRSEAGHEEARCCPEA